MLPLLNKNPKITYYSLVWSKNLPKKLTSLNTIKLSNTNVLKLTSYNYILCIPRIVYFNSYNYNYLLNYVYNYNYKILLIVYWSFLKLIRNIFTLEKQTTLQNKNQPYSNIIKLI